MCTGRKRLKRINLRKNIIIGVVILSVSIASLFILACPLYSAESGNVQKAVNKNYVFNGYELNEKEKSMFKAMMIEDINVFLMGRMEGHKTYTMLDDEVFENIIFVTPDSLQNDYENNEAAVNTKYPGKTLFLSGNIDSIKRDEGNRYVIIFRDGKNISSRPQVKFIGPKGFKTEDERLRELLGEGGVKDNMSTKPKAYINSEYEDYLASLSRGETASLVCEGSKFLNGSAIAINCAPTFILANTYENKFIISSRKLLSEKQSIGMAATAIVFAEAFPEFESCSKQELTKYSDCMQTAMNKIATRKQEFEKAIKNTARKLKMDSAEIKKFFPFLQEQTGNKGGVVY
jgi:hypothetical protein